LNVDALLLDFGKLDDVPKGKDIALAKLGGSCFLGVGQERFERCDKVDGLHGIEFGFGF
jgi:hypothetical protein